MAAGSSGALTAFDAIGDAAEHTRTHLFPMDPRIWVTLGFAAFLDQCGRQGTAGGNVPSPGGGGSSGSGQSPGDWVMQNLALVLAIGAGILILLLAFTALATWLSSRGTFVYIENVATGRAAIAAPWARHADLAWSHFLWRLVMGLATFALAILVIAPVVAVGLKSNPEVDMGPLVIAILVALPFILALGIGGSLLDMLMRDVVAPLQMLRGIPCGPALREAIGLAAAAPLTFLAYVLVKVVLRIAIGTAMTLVCCVTCCAGAIPIVSQTLGQPLFFFERAYSLCFLRRLGVDLLSDEAAGEAAI